MSPASLQSPSNPPASPSTLAGGATQQDSQSPSTGSAGGETPEASTNDALRQTIQKLRGYEMELIELAQRFPAAASSLRQAGTSIRAALRQVIASPGQPEPKAPNIGG